jgi:tetratricopeptide (TPR) repeat protein
LESGLEHEQRNDLAFAHVDYSEAANLAPDDSGARTALTRVEGKIAEQKFNRAMSDGLNALHQNDLRTARSAVKLALTFKPDSQEARNVRAQIAETAQLQRIASYQKHAQDLESDERWKEAAEQYVAILAIAPNVVFAQEGKERSLSRAALSHKLDTYLSEPERLASKQSHDDASTLLKAANQINSKGSKLKSQVSALETLVEAAGTPVSVRLKSDNLTDVIVYKVGALGKFERVELELRPGKYTVVGTRTGYRDVRKELVVAIDKRPEAIVIRCEEKI